MYSAVGCWLFGCLAAWLLRCISSASIPRVSRGKVSGANQIDREAVCGWRARRAVFNSRAFRASKTREGGRARGDRSRQRHRTNERAQQGNRNRPARRASVQSDSEAIKRAALATNSDAPLMRAAAVPNLYFLNLPQFANLAGWNADTRPSKTASEASGFFRILF